MTYSLVEKIIKNYIVIFLILFILIVLSLKSIFSLRYSLLPELNIPIVTVVIENHTLGAEDIERLIAKPVEVAIKSIGNVNRINSICSLGLLAITIEFQWDVDLFLIKQSISEKLSSILHTLPNNTKISSISTASSRIDEVLEFYIYGDTSEAILREIAEYVIKPKIQSVVGVAKVRIFGGEIKQYQVLIDLNKLKSYKLSILDIENAIVKNNIDFTGGILPFYGTEYIVRGIGTVKTLDELKNIVVTSYNGVPITLAMVTNIVEGYALKRGLMEVENKQVVSVTISKLNNFDTIKSIKNIKDALEDIKQFLPKGINFKIYFDQSQLINDAIRNLIEATILGLISVIIVLYLFLNNIILTLISTFTIIVSILITFLFMHFFKISVNIMSLGGIVVGLGTLIDASIVIIENIFKKIELNKTNYNKYDVLNVVIDGTAEVIKPVITSTLIICSVFIPLMILSDFEGKIFLPFAFTMVISILIGLILAFTVVPILTFFMLKFKQTNCNLNFENFLDKSSIKIFTFLQKLTFKYSGGFIIFTLFCFIIAFIIIFNLKVELLPSIDENAIMLSVITPLGSSLDETKRLTNIVCDSIKDIPDIKQILRRCGRAEGSDCIEGVNVSEPYIELVPRLKRKYQIEELFEMINNKVKDIYGVKVIYTQPLANRIEETLSGTSAKFVIKLFGYDQNILVDKGNEILKLISDIPGLLGLKIEQLQGIPTILILPDKVKASKLGINISDIAECIETLIEGKTVSKIYNDGREYDIVIKINKDDIKDYLDLGNIFIESPIFGKIKLSEVCDIKSTYSLGIIKRENLQRKLQIIGNLNNRDYISVVNDIKERLKNIKLPDGYFVSFGGNYEKQIKMLEEISYAFLVAMLLIITILFISFKSIKQILLIIFTIPFALIGGIFALYFTKISINVSSLIGFVAHFGLAVQKGIILIECVNLLKEKGNGLLKSVIKAARLRLRPVLMTSFTTLFGVMPVAFRLGVGSEMQQPLAIVMIGGIITSTIFILLLTPIFYFLFLKNR